MTKKAKLYIKRIFLLIFAFALEGVLGFLLIDGIANHDLAESKVIILIIVLMLLIPLRLSWAMKTINRNLTKTAIK